MAGDGPLRHALDRFPRAARLLRRLAKLAYWAITFQLIGRYRSWRAHQLLVRETTGETLSALNSERCLLSITEPPIAWSRYQVAVVT